MKDIFDAITADTITAFSAFFGLLGIGYQSWQQNKIEKFELIMNLYRELFLNDKFMKILDIMDIDSLIDRNRNIKLIIDNGHDEISERDLVSFLNFFNSLAMLVDKCVLSKYDILEVFQYQIEKMFTTIVLVKYIEEYQFDKIMKIAPDVFFFYGSLSDRDTRSEIKEIHEISSLLKDFKRNVKLNDYVKKDKVRSDLPYPVIVKSNGNHCRGNLVKLSDKASWFEVFNVLDNYEEVMDERGSETALYRRCILNLEVGRTRKILTRQSFVWVYVN
jgi:hypothetical protein